MRTNIIPAQITTVEDKIAGNLSLTQIVLLLTPLFLSVFIYVVLPVKLEFTKFKIILIIFIFTLFLTLSLRIKDRIIISWLTLLISYKIRPRIYVFDKNDVYLRNSALINQNTISNIPAGKHLKQLKVNNIPEVNLFRLDRLLNNSKTTISFRFRKKGGINAYFFKKQSLFQKANQN